MKMTKILSLVLALVMLASCFVACNGGGETTTKNPGGNQSDPPVYFAGEYDITMWVSEKEGVKELFLAQIEKFEAANPGVIINATIEGVTEADAGSQVVADVASAPDMFCFAQDQLARLVQASALAAPGKQAQAIIREANDAGSVMAASVAGTIYAYPMTSDNGYYMYYNKSIISEEDAGSLEKLIKACEDNGLKFRYALENAWYTASFFFAVGEDGNPLCHSQWTMDAEGKFNAVDDNFNSDNGLIAMKGMQQLAQSPAYDSDADTFVDAGVIVTGIWNATTAAEHFGENLGVAKLPSYTVDGKSYQLGSYSGYKLIGVKPQEDAMKAACLSELARFLTNTECSLERFNAFEWGPSNVEAQKDEAVKANESLTALAAQNAFAVPQGQIHGSWWDIAKVLGAEAKAATSDDDLRTALEAYKTAVDATLNQSPEDMKRWGVIGAIDGTNWDTDFEMVEIAEGKWQTAEPITFKVGDEFKLRRGANWDVQVGADGQVKTPSVEPANIVSEVAGSYHIVLEWDGTSDHATVTFVAAE